MSTDTQHPAAPRRPARREGRPRGYGPGPLDELLRIFRCAQLAVAHHKDSTQPIPDWTLIEGEWQHCPIVKTELTAHPQFGFVVMKIYFKDLREHAPAGALRTARLTDLVAALFSLTVLAFGGGAKMNHNGEGPHRHDYPYFFGGDDHIPMRRVLYDTREGQYELDPASGDHHDLCRCSWNPPPPTTKQLRASGKKAKEPYKDYRDAIDTALRYFDQNHVWSRMPLTRNDYKALLEDLIAALYAIPLGSIPLQDAAK